MLYQALHGIAKPLAKAIWRPTIRGLEKFPRTGPVIVASNHLSFVDSVVIPLTCPRQVHFIAKQEYFVQPGLKGKAMKAWFEGVGMLPVDRDSPRAAQDSLDRGLELLQTGEVFGIYPEGTRSKDGRLWRGRTGLGWLVLASGAPVVPVALTGTDKVQPLDRSYPTIAPMTVEYGEPMYLAEQFAGLPAGRARREITDAVVAAIGRMSGQEYTGVYNERTPRTTDQG